MLTPSEYDDYCWPRQTGEESESRKGIFVVRQRVSEERHLAWSTDGYALSIVGTDC